MSLGNYKIDLMIVHEEYCFSSLKQCPLTILNTTPVIQRRRGAVLERWDGIDGYLTQNMVNDSRFPSMPTYLSYASTFNEPINWGNNYGSRIRGYFVPLQTGPHVFFIGEQMTKEDDIKNER